MFRSGRLDNAAPNAFLAAVLRELTQPLSQGAAKIDEEIDELLNRHLVSRDPFTTQRELNQEIQKIKSQILPKLWFISYFESLPRENWPVPPLDVN